MFVVLRLRSRIQQRRLQLCTPVSFAQICVRPLRWAFWDFGSVLVSRAANSGQWRVAVETALFIRVLCIVVFTPCYFVLPAQGLRNCFLFNSFTNLHVTESTRIPFRNRKFCSAHLYPFTDFYIIRLTFKSIMECRIIIIRRYLIYM